MSHLASKFIIFVTQEELIMPDKFTHSKWYKKSWKGLFECWIY